MTTELKVDGIQGAMALLQAARDARAAVQGRIAEVQTDLQSVDASLGAAREELRSEDASIAASGSRMPDKPSPVEERIARLSRHQRILQVRRGLIEQEELKPVDEQVLAAREAVRQEWRRVGMQETENLRTRYREAAALLQAVYAEYVLWIWQFPLAADVYDFPRPRFCPAISELTGGGLLINPLLLATREANEKAAPELAARLRELRAEVDGCCEQE